MYHHHHHLLHLHLHLHLDGLSEATSPKALCSTSLKDDVCGSLALTHPRHCKTVGRTALGSPTLVKWHEYGKVTSGSNRGGLKRGLFNKSDSLTRHLCCRWAFTIHIPEFWLVQKAKIARIVISLISFQWEALTMNNHSAFQPLFRWFGIVRQPSQTSRALDPSAIPGTIWACPKM